MNGVDLSTRIGGLRLPSPVIVAAGCGGTGRELRPYAELSSLGAFTTGTVTLEPHRVRPGLAETPAGLLTTACRPSAGIDAFLEHDLPWLTDRNLRVIVSIAGDDPAESGELARRLVLAARSSVVAVEVNLRTEDLTDRAAPVGLVVGAVRHEVPEDVPVLAKVTPGLAVEVAGAAQRAGADGVTVSGAVPGLVIDPGTLRPAVDGAAVLSGPAVHPVAVRTVYELRAEYPDLAIIGTGGVMTGWDALELVLAGANAVGVGSALLRDPGAAGRIGTELADALATCGLRGVEAACGIAHHGGRQSGVQEVEKPPADGHGGVDVEHGQGRARAWESIR